MKIFFDTEFIEDGKTIDLISIGMVREDGRQFYIISSEFNEAKASEWVKQNVISKLGTVEPRYTRAEIAEAILEFVGNEKPEFWAYYADYDWVVLCQLYGTMMDLPKGWPMFCMDLKQLLESVGNPKIEKLPEDQAHNALSDAVWVANAHTALTARKLA